MENNQTAPPITASNSDQDLQNRLERGFKVRRTDNKPEGEKTADPIQDALKLKKDLLAFKMIDSANLEPGTAVTVHKADEAMATQVLKGYNDVLTTLLSSLLKSREGLPATGQDTEKATLFNYLIDEVKATRAKMTSGNTNPLDMIDEVQKKMTAWQKSMQEQFGPGFQGGGGPGNIEVMRLNLELEDRRTERTQLQIQGQAAENAAERRYQAAEAEAKRKYDAEREDIRRRNEVEDRKWNAEFNLKKDQIKQESAKKSETVDTFKDIAGAFVASLQPGAGTGRGAGAGAGQGDGARQGAVAPEQTRRQPEVNFPTSHTCTELNPQTEVPCGTAFPWPAGQMTAKCPKCGAEYTLETAK